MRAEQGGEHQVRRLTFGIVLCAFGGSGSSEACGEIYKSMRIYSGLSC